MFYGKPLHVACASPRGERSRVPESVQSYDEVSSSTDRMELLEEDINTPLDRSRVDATSDEATATERSSKGPWEKYGLNDNS